MINQITGKIINLNQNNSQIVLLNNGIGFEIKANLKTITSLKRNQEETLHISTIFRETGITLFGFLSHAEKEIFEKVIQVSGIGPKSALSILEILSVNDFISAVIKEDTTLISSAQGIGKKTAQRLILELKNSFKKIHLSKDQDLDNDFSSREEVYSVLTGLGFSATDINDKLKIAQEKNEADDTESLVRFCLAN
jgi:holliday junction DNA helicase RuvA